MYTQNRKKEYKLFYSLSASLDEIFSGFIAK